MTRNQILALVAGLACAICAFRFAQDKPSTAPNESSHVGLAKNEAIEVKDGKAIKQFTIDTEGFDEARISIWVRAEGAKKEFGKTAWSLVVARIVPAGGGFYTISEIRPNIANQASLNQFHDFKIRSAKSLVMIQLSNLECEKVLLSADAYLVK